jgi:acyl carrier protein
VNSAELDETKTITLDEIEAIVRDVLADDAIALRLDSRPREIEGWDSLANVSIVFGVEESLGVRLGTDVLIGIETVGDLVSAVEDARSQTTQVVGLS